MKQTKMKKRVLAWTLCMSMTTGMMPAMTVAASGTDPQPEGVFQEKNAAVNMTEALEDIGEVSVRNGASLVDDWSGGKMVSVTAGWISGGNSTGNGGGIINSADTYFRKSAFTLYTDVMLTGDGNEKDGMIIIGTADGSFKIRRNSDGGAVLSVGSVSGDAYAGTEYPLNISFSKNKWYAVGITYQEDETQGYAAVYVDGSKVSDDISLGFKLSEKSGITAGVGIAFKTGFMQVGSYDNIKVSDSGEGEAAAAETAARAEVLADADTDAKLLVISGSDIEKAAENVNGLTWKGWGLLSGNGTSNLLLDYKAENPSAYEEMIQYLFGGTHPIFTHIKMEMGNDGNNSTAAEACTMRTEDEEADASRDPGFQLAADVKRMANPDVKVSFLRWEMPNWVKAAWDSDRSGKGYPAMYKWYRETIFDVYEKYGYVVDFVNPDKNETGDPDEDFIKWFANQVENEKDFPDYFTEAAKDAYHKIRIIASDENKGLNIVPSMRNDAALYNAVDIIGFHYRTNATDDYVKMAEEDDKEVWYSEGCATFGYSEFHENKTTEYGQQSLGGHQSPLAMAEGFMVSFVSSRRTHYIFQPAIGSFYEGIQYGHKELLSARDPWSGYIHYDPALQVIAQFSRFAETGWENEENNAGVWRMIPNASGGAFAGGTNEHNTSGIDGAASYVTIASPDKKDFSVVFMNNTRNEKKFCIRTKDMPEAAAGSLHLWETSTDNYMKYRGTAGEKNGMWEITLAPYSILTATTLDDYTDGTETGTTPEELSIPTGVNTENRGVLDTDRTGKQADVTDEYLYADNFEYEEEADDYLASRGNEPRYMLDTHGAWIVEGGRLMQANDASVNQWNGGDPMTIVGDFRWMNYQTQVDVEIPGAVSDRWAGLGIRTQTGMNWNNDGYTLRVYGSGKWELYRGASIVRSGSTTKNSEGKYKLGLAAQNSQITVLIDGQVVDTYTDSTPLNAGRVKLSSSWAKTYFDNLEVKNLPGTIPYATSMVDGSDDSIAYGRGWKICSANVDGNSYAGSADRWYRTNTMNTEANAEFTFTFPTEGTGFSVIGNNGAETKLDVYVDGEETPYAADAVTSTSGNRYASYTLAGLENKKHTVRVVVKEGTLNIDALYTLGEVLPGEQEFLIAVQDDTLPSSLVVKEGETVKAPKETVKVLTASGEVKEMKVNWDTDGSSFTTPFSATSISGTVEGGRTSYGTELKVSIPVTVIPANMLYFANMSSDPVSSDYTAMMDAAADTLLHTAEKHDQAYNESAQFGYVGTAGTLRTTNADLYESMRYAGKGETITYQFDVEAGLYNVYVGMFDPAGWYGSHKGKRYADISVNNQVVTDEYQYLNNTKDTLAYQNIAVGEDGKLTVAVAPGQNSSEAIQVSFIAVSRKGEAEKKPVEEIFGDVSKDDWFRDDVQYVYDQGFMKGIANGAEFGTMEALTRAQLATILYRMEGSPKASGETTTDFPDVEEGCFYTDAVRWAAANGIIYGYPQTGKFEPDRAVSREEMAVMVYRYAKYKSYDTKKQADLTEFSDGETVSEFAEDAMRFAVAEGLITGEGKKTLNPQGSAIRVAGAAVIHRFADRVQK